MLLNPLAKWTRVSALAATLCGLSVVSTWLGCSTGSDTSGGSQDGSATPCVPGRSVACAGPGGCSGYQTCRSDGSGFDPCQCESAPDATLDSRAADADAADAAWEMDTADATPDGTLSDGSALDAPGEVAVTTDSALLDASLEAESGGETGSEAGGGGALCSPYCASGQKMTLVGTCVPVTDPVWGCSAPNADYCNVPHAVPTCNAAGHCDIGTCRPGWSDCNSSPSDGCESDLTLPQNCGQCGNSCAPGQVCTSTGCAATCPFPMTNCGGACVDLTTSLTNCGKCGTACQSYALGTATCAGGTCSS
jgi:hypothetical protein